MFSSLLSSSSSSLDSLLLSSLVGLIILDMVDVLVIVEEPCSGFSISSLAIHLFLN